MYVYPFIVGNITKFTNINQEKVEKDILFCNPLWNRAPHVPGYLAFTVRLLGGWPPRLRDTRNIHQPGLIKSVSSHFPLTPQLAGCNCLNRDVIRKSGRPSTCTGLAKLYDGAGVNGRKNFHRFSKNSRNKLDLFFPTFFQKSRFPLDIVSPISFKFCYVGHIYIWLIFLTCSPWVIVQPGAGRHPVYGCSY